MIKIDLEKEEIQMIIIMMESSTVKIIIAEKALKLLNKFKLAAKS